MNADRECGTCGYPTWRAAHDLRIHWVRNNWDEAIRLHRIRRRTIRVEDVDDTDWESVHVTSFHDWGDGVEVCAAKGNLCQIIIRERRQRRMGA